MTTCTACAQLLDAEARRCPACGNDLRTRRLAVPRADHDDELDADLLLTAAIAVAGTHGPPPPLVPPLEQRLRAGATPLVHALRHDDQGDLLPAGTLVRRRGLRRLHRR
jgi:hypothetical protein